MMIFSWTFVDDTSNVSIDETRHGGRNVSRYNDGYLSLNSDSDGV